jgi:TPR repeat protein
MLDLSSSNRLPRYHRRDAWADGFLMEHGDGVEMDKSQSAHHAKVAADRGDIVAQKYFGHAPTTGWYCHRQIAVAQKYFGHASLTFESGSYTIQGGTSAAGIGSGQVGGSPGHRTSARL